MKMWQSSKQFLIDLHFLLFFSVLNTFLVWSLVRSYLPFLPYGFRSSLEDFERTLYGIQKSPPAWYFCTKLINNWMPLAIDVLQNNPLLTLVS